jgi:Tol biopolymer transport system component
MALNSLENLVYETVKDNVVVKNHLKWLYQLIFSTFSASVVDTDLILRERPRTFFGFHDKSPWSGDGRHLLGHSIQGLGTGEGWRKGKPVEISVFYGENWTRSTTVGRTRAWNWQQGSQLQWLGDEKKVVYNDFRDGVCRAVVQSLDTDSERIWDYPVAAVSPDGTKYASICFETFGRAMDGYGYAFNATRSRSNVPSGALVIVDGRKPETRITLDDLSTEIEPQSDGIDFFSHCLFSPDGERLIFLRRQSRPNQRLRSEMFCVDIAGDSIRRIGFKDMVSHFTWLGPDVLLAYANTEDGGDGFYVADVEGESVTDWTDCLNDRDGHPHATPTGDVVVFDTYPDRARYQHLLVWRRGEEQSRTIAKIPSPMKFWGASRVDLHPRVRSDGEYISFDAGFSGTRSLITAKLPS